MCVYNCIYVWVFLYSYKVYYFHFLAAEAVGKLQRIHSLFNKLRQRQMNLINVINFVIRCLNYCPASNPFHNLPISSASQLQKRSIASSEFLSFRKPQSFFFFFFSLFVFSVWILFPDTHSPLSDLVPLSFVFVFQFYLSPFSRGSKLLFR